jgi:hypothetical protein
MRAFLCAIVLLFFSNISQAQKYHFAYLQTDDKQTFYVRVNDKTYSSSAAGYLVIPKLTPGTYNLLVGFPKNQWPMQTITIEIGEKDLGYLLKNFGDKGWGLFNINTMNVVYASSGQPAAPVKIEESSGSGFSDILADVVSTPSIKEKTREEPAKRTQVAEPAIPVVKETVDVAVKETSQVPALASQVNIAAEKEEKTLPAKNNSVKRVSIVSDDHATVMIYHVQNGDALDTVSVILPPKEETMAYVSVQDPSPEMTEVPVEQKQITIELESKPSEPGNKPRPDPVSKNEPRFIDMELNNPNDNSATGEKPTPKANPATEKENKEVSNEKKSLVMINSDCKKFADEGDFLKTRKKMAAEASPEDMIATARKLFQQKCYSVEQVKNLAVLFRTDEGKYKFFDTAYPYIHNTQQFSGLEAELDDEYYKTRFRAMIKK